MSDMTKLPLAGRRMTAFTGGVWEIREPEMARLYPIIDCGRGPFVHRFVHTPYRGTAGNKDGRLMGQPLTLLSCFLPSTSRNEQQATNNEQ